MIDITGSVCGTEDAHLYGASELVSTAVLLLLRLFVSFLFYLLVLPPLFISSTFSVCLSLHSSVCLFVCHTQAFPTRVFPLCFASPPRRGDSCLLLLIAAYPLNIVGSTKQSECFHTWRLRDINFFFRNNDSGNFLGKRNKISVWHVNLRAM